MSKLLSVLILLLGISATSAQLPSSAPSRTIEQQIRWSMGLPMQPKTVLPTELPKYRVGDGIVELVNGCRTNLVVVRVYWDGYQWQYVKVPDPRIEI